MLAEKARGKTSPNPLVGAVIVKNGEIVGEGYHPQAGKPHAEIYALTQAGEKAENATIYVNLEPCNHYGKTPPCTEALIKAGIKQVIIGMVDPDPRVSGSGIKKLMEAGIDVTVGVAEKLCLKLNEAFIHRVTQKRPFGIFKYAMTLDGKIATKSGHSQWITGKSSRQFVHQLRSGCDAVIVGGNTVRLDNPLLTSHEISDKNPLRVVMTKSFQLPSQAQLWETNTHPTVIFTLPQQETAFKKQLLASGVEIVEMENLSTTAVMNNLYQRGFNTVLWECGGNLANSAIIEGNVQKIYSFIAPKIVGGNNGFSPIGDLNINTMGEARCLKDVTINPMGEDFLVEGYLS